MTKYDFYKMTSTPTFRKPTKVEKRLIDLMVRVVSQTTCEQLQRFMNLMPSDEMGIDFGYYYNKYLRDTFRAKDDSVLMYGRITTDNKVVIQTAEVSLNGRKLWELSNEEIENAPKGYWEWKEMEEE